MHCGRSVRRSPATPDTKAGFDEPAFFLFGASRRQPEAPKYSLHRLRRRAASRSEVAGAIKKPTT